MASRAAVVGLLKELTEAVKDQGEKITTMHRLLVKLPAQVSRGFCQGSRQQV